MNNKITTTTLITSKHSERKRSFELSYLHLAALAAIFKKSTVIESHISSIKTRKIMWAGASNAGAWQGLCSMNDF